MNQEAVIPTAKKQKQRKPPIIRKGNKKAFRRATNEEIQERTEYAAKMLIRLKTKMEIHRAMRRKFNIEWRQIDVYITHAKKYLASRSRMDAEEARGIGVNALLRVIAEGKHNEIVQAERRWAEIWGYNAPQIIRDNTRPDATVTISNPQVSAPVVHLILPAGRAAGIMPCESAPPEPPQPVSPTDTTTPK